MVIESEALNSFSCMLFLGLHLFFHLKTNSGCLASTRIGFGKRSDKLKKHLNYRF